jgi:trans-aconitate methyltransferase
MPVSHAQYWSPEQYAENARFVSDLGMPVVELLSPQPGERILDLGCGDGALTIKLQEFGCEVVGVDSSPEMVAAASSRGLDARGWMGKHLNSTTNLTPCFPMPRCTG